LREPREIILCVSDFPSVVVSALTGFYQLFVILNTFQTTSSQLGGTPGAEKAVQSIRRVCKRSLVFDQCLARLIQFDIEVSEQFPGGQYRSGCNRVLIR